MAIAYADYLKKPVGEWYAEMLVTGKVPRYLASLLQSMEGFHAQTFSHLLRVGCLCYCVDQLTRDRYPDFWLAGLGHDIGKLGTPVALLNEKSSWCAASKAIMRRHVMDGYNVLEPKLPFVAHIVVRSHRFQVDPYPHITELPPLPQEYTALEEEINRQANWLAIVDCYDALHRDNRRNGPLPLTGAQIQERMLTLWSSEEGLVKDLYTTGIFTASD